MPVDATWRIQSNSGLVTGTTTGFTVTLPNPTADGSTLLLWIAATGSGAALNAYQQAFDPPFFTDAVHSPQDYVWRRDSQPAGETSWAITQQAAIAANFSWWAEEWSGLSAIGQPDANTSVFVGTNPASISTNTATADVSDFAALAFFRSGWSGSGNTWPSGRSYPSGWHEVACLTSGTGGVNTDCLLAIAESYPGASGSVQCTLTWDTTGGGTIPAATDAWVACYQPAAAAPPTGLLTS